MVAIRTRSFGRSRDRCSETSKTQEAGVDQLVVVVEFENLEKAVAAFKRSSQLI